MSGRMMVVPLPHGFDPGSDRWMSKLDELLAQRAPGYGVYRVETDHNRALILPKEELAADMSVTVDTYKFDAVGASNIPKLVASMEEKNPGKTVTSVDTTTGLATMQVVDDKTLYARRLFAAALNLHPWEVRVFATQAHGWRVKLPDGFAYRASRYETPF